MLGRLLSNGNEFHIVLIILTHNSSYLFAICVLYRKYFIFESPKIEKSWLRIYTISYHENEFEVRNDFK